MVSVSSQLPRELPKLSSANKSLESIDASASKSYTPIRNRLAEQNSRPMNQTYTIGTRPLLQAPQKSRERSCSIDSDIAEYTIHGAISGLFPRAYQKSNGNINTSSTPSRSPSSNTLTRVFSTKLPSLDGCSPERKCCQRPFGRAQFDLHKYKESIKNSQ